MRVEAEPHHLDALLKFAARAYRRPLTPAERDEIAGVLPTLREKSGLTHEEAIRDSIVSVLMSPHFCYRIDLAEPRRPRAEARRGRRERVATSGRSPPYALASRLSYFLWSSMPDDELLAHAAAGDLQQPEVLLGAGPPDAEGRARARPGDRVRAATGSTSAASRSTTPSIASASRASPTNCAQAMFEEPVRFIVDVDPQRPLGARSALRQATRS